MEPIDCIEKETDGKPTNNRIILEPESLVALEKHLAAVSSSLGGLVSVSIKQLTNFILQHRSGELSPEELELLKARYTDKVKLLQAIIDRARMAKKEGRNHSIEDEIKIFETLGVNAKPPHKRLTKRRADNPARSETQEGLKTTGEPLASLESPVDNRREMPVERKKKPTVLLVDTVEDKLAFP